MTGVCLGFIAWVFARHIFEIDYCKVNFKSYMFLSFVVAGKFVSGFFHAFIDDAKDRALGLLIVNGCVLVVLLFCCKTMQIKTYFIIYLGIYLGKVVLHIQLLYEMWVPEVLIKIEGSASENSLILVISIFGFMLMISFISIFKSISTFITKRAKPKLHSH